MANCGVKFKAYPTEKQAKILSGWIGCARVIYNCKVEEDQQNYKLYKESGEKIAPNQAYSLYKTEEREWLNNCPAQILRNSSSNWFTAKQRFFKELAGNPKKKKKGIKDTITLTSDVFSLKDINNKDGASSKKLFIGAKKNNIGFLKFNAHREYGNPNQIVVGKKNGEWYVSFSYGNGISEKDEKELLSEFSLLDQTTLKEFTIGIDRGIAIPFQISQK